MGFGIDTVTETVGTSATFSRLPVKCVMIMLRAPSSNTDPIYVSLGSVTATSGDLRISPGETVTIDLSNMLMLKIMLGGKPVGDDFITSLSFISSAAAQTLYVDAFAFNTSGVYME